jgi:Tfp pilus assembly protein PilN
VNRVVGIAVERNRLAAVAVRRGRIVWAAETAYQEPADLAGVIAGLAAERPRGFRAACVALGPEVARIKHVDGLPRLRPADLAAHVRLQSRRYFLQNGASLVTDAVAAGGRGSGTGTATLAAAAEPIVEAVGAGLHAAALALQEMAPSVLFAAPEADAEMGRLQQLGFRAASFRDAYAAAVARRPPLALLPAELRRERDRQTTRSLVRWAALCAGSMLLAGATYVGALAHQGRTAAAELDALRPALAAALAVRRDLEAATASLEVLQQADLRRPRLTRLLTELTSALPDSVFLRALRVERDGRGALMGYAAQASAALTALERTRGITDPELDGAVTREVVGGREWERFGLRFRIVRTSGARP